MNAPSSSSSSSFEERSFQLCKDILELDAAVVYSCLVDNVGNVIAAEHRDEAPFLERREVEQYVLRMTIAAALFSNEFRMGEMQYSITYRENVAQLIVPASAGSHRLFFLLLVKRDSDTGLLVDEKLIPFIARSAVL